MDTERVPQTMPARTRTTLSVTTTHGCMDLPKSALQHWVGPREVVVLGFTSMRDLAQAYRGWVEESIENENRVRDGKWTESVAVGSEAFVAATKEKLGFKARGREVIGVDGSYELREPAPYTGLLGHENAVLRPQNVYFLEDIVYISTRQLGPTRRRGDPQATAIPVAGGSEDAEFYVRLCGFRRRVDLSSWDIEKWKGQGHVSCGSALTEHAPCSHEIYALLLCDRESVLFYNITDDRASLVMIRLQFHDNLGFPRTTGWNGA